MIIIIIAILVVIYKRHAIATYLTSKVIKTLATKEKETIKASEPIDLKVSHAHALTDKGKGALTKSPMPSTFRGCTTLLTSRLTDA